MEMSILGIGAKNMYSVLNMKWNNNQMIAYISWTKKEVFIKSKKQ